ncbi:MAG TPA: helix-turn-helix domain-containing protein [Nitrosopumilaceae archaeon]|nr:helix-turn-helix domain-containing protein [Nitrosopumilaceae archaeon]
MKTTEQVATTVFDSEPNSQLHEYKMDLEKICNELLKFGLTRNQAKVFIYLGKYGSKTSPEVCKALKLPRTETYNVLNDLLNLGIISSEFHHPIKYSALPMGKAIMTMINDAQENVNKLAKKELELAQLWNKIPTFNSNSIDNKLEKFQMLQGIPRINNKLKEMIKDAKNEIKIICTEKDLSRFYYSDFLDMLGSLPIDVKLIISPTQKIPRFIQTLDRSKIRLTPTKDADNQCFIVKDSNEVMVFLRNADQTSRNAFAFWTDTSSLIASMKKLFNFSWHNSLPLDFERFLESHYN